MIGPPPRFTTAVGSTGDWRGPHESSHIASAGPAAGVPRLAAALLACRSCPGLRRLGGGRRPARRGSGGHGRHDALPPGPGRHTRGRKGRGRAGRAARSAGRAGRAPGRDPPGQPRPGRHRSLRAAEGRAVPAHRGRDRRDPAAVPGRARERARRVAGGRRLRRRRRRAGCRRADHARLRDIVGLHAGRGSVVRAPVSRGDAGGDERRAHGPGAQGHRQVGRPRVEPHPGRGGGGRRPGSHRAGDRPGAGERGRRRGRIPDFPEQCSV